GFPNDRWKMEKGEPKRDCHVSVRLFLFVIQLLATAVRVVTIEQCQQRRELGHIVEAIVEDRGANLLEHITDRRITRDRDAVAERKRRKFHTITANRCCKIGGSGERPAGRKYAKLQCSVLLFELL